MLAGLCMVVIVNAVDSLPNAPYTSFQYFLPGALLGFLQGLAGAGAATQVKSTRKTTAKATPAEPRYLPNLEASS